MPWKRTGQATRWLAPGLLVAVLALSAVPASAKEPSVQERSAARALAQQGDALWDNDDYESALDKFIRAYELVRVPTLALRQAECLEKLGRLVEASEKYEEISRVSLDPGAPEAFKSAVDAARDQAVSVRARLPMLTVVVSGDKLDAAKLTVDGKDVPAALWGTGFPTDPGWHDIELVKGERRAQARVSLREKGAQTVTITLPPGEGEPEAAAPPAEAEAPPSPPPAAPAQPAPVAAEPTQPAPPPVAADTTESSQALWGWIGLGVGAAGLIAGGVTATLLTMQKSDLDDSCKDARCPSTERDEVDSYNQLRPIPTIGFAVGAVGVGAGLYLLLSAPDSPEQAQTGIRPWVAVGSAGVEGRF